MEDKKQMIDFEGELVEITTNFDFGKQDQSILENEDESNLIHFFSNLANLKTKFNYTSTTCNEFIHFFDWIMDAEHLKLFLSNFVFQFKKFECKYYFMKGLF